MNTTCANRPVSDSACICMCARRKVSRVGVLPVVFFGLGVAACGGTAGSSQPPVGVAFASRAVAVCHAAYALKKAVPFPYPTFNPIEPDTSKFPSIARYEALHTVPAYKTWLADMQALGPPPTGQAAWTDLLAAIAGHVQSASEQQAAAQRGDAQTFIKDYYEGVKTQSDLLTAANAAGIPECASVDR
jgi:hypothetical protein